MTLQSLSSAQFESVLTNENIRQMQILQGAMGMGVLVFGMVVAFFASTSVVEPKREDVELIQILTLAHLLILSGGAAMANVLFRSFFSEGQLAAAAKRKIGHAGTHNPDDPAVKAFAHVRSAVILRLGILEAPALFGLVICLLMANSGVARVAPIYFLNALSAAGFLVYIVTTFPDKDRLARIFNDNILRGS